jgi:hypothetical protein
MIVGRKSLTVALMPLLLLGTVLASAAAARPVEEKGALGTLPRLGAGRPPTYVGVDSAGRAVAVALTGEHELVAYVCDGGQTGAWFRGTFADDSTTATLKGKRGATLTLDLGPDPLSGRVTIGGAEENFTLVPAVGSAGLYREQRGGKVSGWIVDNTGNIIGLTQNPDGEVGGGGSTGAPSGDAQATSFGQSLKCGFAQFRLERTRIKAAKEGAFGPTAGEIPVAEANRDSVCGFHG